MLPDLDASLVLNYLHDPTPDDGVALDLLLHDDDTPLLDIDAERTLNPTPNDPLTSAVPSPTIPSPTNSQSSHAALIRTSEEVLHCTTTIETTPLNMLASSNGSLHGGVSDEHVPEYSLSNRF